MLKHTIRLLAITALTMILGGLGIAHEVKGVHGGRVSDAAGYHIELVVKNDTVEVFFSDKASKPISATGLTGLAIVVANGASTRIPLTAADPNKLSGKAAAKLAAGAKSVVQVKLADGQTIQASFD